MQTVVAPKTTGKLYSNIILSFLGFSLNRSIQSVVFYVWLLLFSKGSRPGRNLPRPVGDVVFVETVNYVVQMILGRTVLQEVV